MLEKLTGIILLCCSHSVFALTIDVGMLTLAEGNVEIVSGQDAQHPATAFSKLALGDQLILSENARVQIVYFESSRQELWSGAGIVEIGKEASRSVSLQAIAKKLPPLVARQLIKTPASGQHGKVGMVTVRSLSSDTIESLEKQYNEFRAASASGDTTPEVFLLTGLLEMKEYKHAEEILNGFRARQEAAPALRAVIAHFEPILKEVSSDQRP